MDGGGGRGAGEEGKEDISGSQLTENWRRVGGEGGETIINTMKIG